MNEVSIIINGVRYDAVEHIGRTFCCDDCDLLDNCLSTQCCGFLIGGSKIFKKSNKKFEK